MTRSMIRALCVRVAVILCLVVLPPVTGGGGSAAASEQITRFAADIAVQPSGDLMVTETIAVRAAGDRIRRGIYRDIPLTGPEGRRLGFSLVSADRDGHPVPTEVTWNDAGVRVRLGDPAQDLPRGNHVFTLTYRASGTLTAGEAHDLLRWEVTGTGWEFPIAEAAARVTLPGATPPAGWKAVTGAAGSGESNVDGGIGSDGALSVRSRLALPPGHGLTVAVDIPRGLAETAGAITGDEPQAADADLDLEPIAPMAGLPMVLGAVGVVLIYFGAVWWWLGRDPAAGQIIPRPMPPANMSPAAVRFVRQMGYDTRCLAAALVNMAVNGFLTIDRRADGGWQLHRTGAPDTALFPEERAVANKLFFAMAFERGLDDADGRWLRQANDALKEALEAGNNDRLFVTNRLFLGIGVALSVVAGIAMLAAIADIGSAVILGLILAAVAGIAWFLGRHVVRHARQVARGRGIGRALWFLAFTVVPALLIGLVIMVGMLAVVSVAVLAGLLALTGIAVFFAWALKAPTHDGRRVQDEIEGMAAFITQSGGAAGAAAAMADAALPPDRYLPYALALDLEQSWALGFGAALAASAAVASAGIGDVVATPHTWAWYGGGGGDPLRLSDDLGHGLTAGIDSVTTAPDGSGDGSGSSSSSSGISVGGGFGGGGGGGF
ncbi:DUF2207 domain-containing protein [Caenispirillum bisanense]|uniref:DUF2207 domain-containing protein n=1 Tax=Caenispirillum bisanense TaxID=414052 RepID=UPI0031DB2ACF